MPETKQATWQHYPHPADMGIRGTGPTKAEAFEQAALALTAVIAEPDTIEARQKITLSCGPEPDDELLFITWLNTLLYEMAIQEMLFCRFEVKLFEDNTLTAQLWGQKLDQVRHQPSVEVKAATFGDLKVEPTPDGIWIAQCIVDV